jgi:hypothetical protein
VEPDVEPVVQQPDPEPPDAVEPVAEAPPKVSKYGSVFISGEVEAFLIGTDGTRRSPGGKVIPDTYTVEAVFPGTGRTRTNTRFELRAGDIVHIVCDADFAICQRP